MYFFPFTRDTLPPVFFAYVFSADVDLKVLGPLDVVTLGIVTTPRCGSRFRVVALASLGQHMHRPFRKEKADGISLE